MMQYLELIRPEAVVASLVFLIGCAALGAMAIYVDNKREEQDKHNPRN